MCDPSFFMARISCMSQFKVRYEPPAGYPLGTNLTFKICANIIIPIFNLFMSRDWKGAENIPSSGRVIVASNHMSYLESWSLPTFSIAMVAHLDT